MTRNKGIILDLFPPLSWDEEGITTALQTQEEADGEEGWDFSEEEIRYLAKVIAYYRSLPKREREPSFIADGEVDFDDPYEDGRIVIDMAFPDHLEPPASLLGP